MKLLIKRSQTSYHRRTILTLKWTEIPFDQFIKIKSFILQERLISFIFRARETYKEVGDFRKSLFSKAFTL